MSAVLLALAAAGPVHRAVAAEPAARMASDRGCYNCHGEPPRRNVPSFSQLAERYASYRGKPDLERAAVDRMHHGGMFSHVAAHERLAEDEAAALVRWLVEGGR